MGGKKKNKKQTKSGRERSHLLSQSTSSPLCLPVHQLQLTQLPTPPALAKADTLAFFSGVPTPSEAAILDCFFGILVCHLCPFSLKVAAMPPSSSHYFNTDSPSILFIWSLFLVYSSLFFLYGGYICLILGLNWIKEQLGRKGKKKGEGTGWFDFKSRFAW